MAVRLLRQTQDEVRSRQAVRLLRQTQDEVRSRQAKQASRLWRIGYWKNIRKQKTSANRGKLRKGKSYLGPALFTGSTETHRE